MITESGIIAPQLDGVTIINDYVHNNVFRGMMDMPYYGIQIDGEKTKGTSWTKEFTLTLPPDGMPITAVPFLSFQINWNV
jgi:hypothetical protein